VPFGVDALVIVLAAKYAEVFWIFPPLAAAVSLAAAALTYWAGRTAGYSGLPRLVPSHSLERLRSRVSKTGAGALAIAAVLPPPFPLTAFLLTCGALDVDRRRFFLVFGLLRLIRFSGAALLARQYGDRVLELLTSHELRVAGMAIVLACVTAAIASGVVLWFRVRPQPVRA
jgi:membrane protein YqaA with SNARE-associated domain